MTITISLVFHRLRHWIRKSSYFWLYYNLYRKAWWVPRYKCFVG